MTEYKPTFEVIKKLIEDACDKYDFASSYDTILAISRGGLVPATIISHYAKIPTVLTMGMMSYMGRRRSDINVYQKPIFTEDNQSVLIVDDINDTGSTFRFVQDLLNSKEYHLSTHANFAFDLFAVIEGKDTIMPSLHALKLAEKAWTTFPWERQ